MASSSPNNSSDDSLTGDKNDSFKNFDLNIGVLKLMFLYTKF
jgi:hypothetical protein